MMPSLFNSTHLSLGFDLRMVVSDKVIAVFLREFTRNLSLRGYWVTELVSESVTPNVIPKKAWIR